MKIGELDKLLKPLTERDTQMGLVPTLKDILIESVGRKKAKNMKQALGYHKLADKIMEAKDFVELGDMEYNTLKEGLEENPSRYFPYYLSQAWEKIQ